MKKFIIKDDFWDLFPETKIGIILCNGIDNTVKDNDEYKTLLLKSTKEAQKYLSNQEFSQNDVIQVWREAYKKFKTKKGARSSIEALLKRVYKGNTIGTINPLVDIYNSISLKYGIPCGGEDIDTFAGDIVLTKATGEEQFITLGSNKSEPPYLGEIVYKDDNGAICRCWNWRESVRTMLTEKTVNAFICMELVNNERIETLEKALRELAEMIELYLGGHCHIEILDINKKEINIEE